ncbi:hypothetical protein OJ34_23655 [Salmonella enterica subsp. enterica]|nr:hypothetical protein [Salmonella enterica]EBP3306014.1 hypothetical protein [Salmonella enterica subsp. enterica]EBU3153485.1 hypothetical protein [Salmonella enterica]ELQ0128259.1 hypothetical protein [Salmonella enterica]
MSENRKKSTTGQTSNEDKSLQEAIVSDQFKKIIDEAFEKTKSILQKRYDNLTKEWDSYKDEFSSIFGIDGDDTIFVNYYTRGQQIDPDNVPRTPRNTPSEMEMTAHQFMIDGVKRLMDICEKLYIDNREYDKIWGFDRYGSFINETALTLGAARVRKGQTLNALPSQYKERIHIEILHRFREITRVTGRDSRVSTLCHELSHLIIFKENGVYYGGMGTDDIIPNGVPDTNENYTKHANSLVRKKSKKVFNNAYNIEKYFEVKI